VGRKQVRGHGTEIGLRWHDHAWRGARIGLDPLDQRNQFFGEGHRGAHLWHW
jgi:hypothetical protein